MQFPLPIIVIMRHLMCGKKKKNNCNILIQKFPSTKKQQFSALLRKWDMEFCVFFWCLHVTVCIWWLISEIQMYSNNVTHRSTQRWCIFKPIRNGYTSICSKCTIAHVTCNQKKEQAISFVAVLQPHAVYVCLFLSSALRKKTVILLWWSRAAPILFLGLKP